MHLAGDTSTYQRKNPHCVVIISLYSIFFKSIKKYLYIQRIEKASNILPCRLKTCTVFLFSLQDKGEKHMLEKNFLNAADVSEYMNISIPMAYKIIRKLNDELKSQGFLTVSGRVNRNYFEHKVNGFSIA